MVPPSEMINLACDYARKSLCVKSKRGVVIFEHGVVDDVHGTGFNGPPAPFFCDRSSACRKDCGVVCMHAEMRALLAVSSAIGHKWVGAQIVAGEPWAPTQKLHLVHVKVHEEWPHELVAGKGPCCELCSRMILDVGIDTVWLYEAGRDHGSDAIEDSHQWRGYTAAEFHRTTLENLGFHISKELNHRFSRQHRSRYCAACGEEDYHQVHKL